MHNGGPDAFVTQLNPTGTGLVYSTFLGGSSDDYGNGIALGPAGSFFVAGYTSSGDFPVTPGAFDTFPDGSASFIVKFGGYDSASCGIPTAGSLLSTDSQAGHRGSMYYTNFYFLQGSAGQRVTIDLNVRRLRHVPLACQSRWERRRPGRQLRGRYERPDRLHAPLRRSVGGGGR